MPADRSVKCSGSAVMSYDEHPNKVADLIGLSSLCATERSLTKLECSQVCESVVDKGLREISLYRVVAPRPGGDRWTEKNPFLVQHHQLLV